MKYILTISLLLFLASMSVAQSESTTSETTEPAQSAETQEKTSEEEKDEEKKEEEKAEETAQEESSETVSGKVEKIQVTGSYIKRIDLEGPSPLVTIDKDYFNVVGSQTVSDVLKERSYFDGVDSEAFVTFHGQTSADTLVLLNGMRLPKTAGDVAVNIDFIPNSSVERIEVLKDGASALYGSEAIAGVVNVITKKDYDGASVDLRYTYPELGKNQEANVVGSYGTNFSKGNVLAVVQYRDTQPLVWDDVGAGIDDTSVGGSPFGNPANLRDNSNLQWNRSADCNPDDIAGDRGGFCGYDYLRFRNFSSGFDKQHLSTLLTSRYEVSEAVNLKSTIVYTRREWDAQNNPIPLQLTVPQAVANSWAAGGRILDANGNQANFGGDATLYYMAEEELGITRSHRTVDSGTVQLGADGYLSDTWSWDLVGAYGLTQFRDDTTQGDGDLAAIQARVDNNTFNPFKPSGQKDSLDAERIATWFEHKSDVTDIRLVTTGELIDLGAGPLSMAIGSEAVWESFEFNNDPLSLAGIPIGGADSNQSGERNIHSGFVEFTSYPIKSLEVQLAGRFDQYSDVGSTFNPKLAAMYRLSSKMLLRSSYGTAFKAPDLLSVNQGSSTGITTFRDETACQDPSKGDTHPDCISRATNVITSGNKALKPETAYNFNLGTVIQPVQSLTLTVDYWQSTGEQGLQDITPGTATLWEYRYGNQFVRDLGIIIDRDGAGDITNFELPVKVNAGEFKVKGIDLSLNYDFNMDLPLLGKARGIFASEHTQSLDSGGRDGPGAPFVYAYDINWKNTTSLSIVKEKHLYRFAVRSLSGGDKDTDQNVGVGRGTVPSFTVYDGHYQYTGSWGGRIQFGVKNLLDSRLPANDLDGFYVVSASNFNPVGRRWYLGYGQDF